MRQGTFFQIVLPNSIIGEAYTSPTGWETLETLVDIESRLAGSAGEAEAAKSIADRFRRYGLREVSVESFEVSGWSRGSATLELERGGRLREFSRQHEVLALPRSPAGTVTAEVVDLGDGSPETFKNADLEGRIAMLSDQSPSETDRWIHRNEKYYRAVEAGAAGFVFRGSRDGCLPPTGDVGSGDEPGPIPAVGVSKEVGDRIVRRYEPEMRITLRVACENENETSQNVQGVLGPRDGPEILVTAHHDAHDIAEGAVDNGAGCAMVVEVARILSEIKEQLQTRVRFATFGSEEYGTLGAEAWIESHGLDDVVCIVNMDAVGSSDTLLVHTNAFESIDAVVADLTSELDASAKIETGLLPWGDHWPFVNRGVPGVLVSSIHGGDSLRGWEHTHGDTLDKLDVRDFRALVVPIAELVVRLSARADELERVPDFEIRDAAIEEELDVGMRVTGEWPWS